MLGGYWSTPKEKENLRLGKLALPFPHTTETGKWSGVSAKGTALTYVRENECCDDFHRTSAVATVGSLKCVYSESGSDFTTLYRRLELDGHVIAEGSVGMNAAGVSPMKFSQGSSTAALVALEAAAAREEISLELFLYGLPYGLGPAMNALAENAQAWQKSKRHVPAEKAQKSKRHVPAEKAHKSKRHVPTENAQNPKRNEPPPMPCPPVLHTPLLGPVNRSAAFPPLPGMRPIGANPVAPTQWAASPSLFPPARLLHPRPS